MSESLPPDTEVGGYRLHRVLGRGGMGVVYVAEHLHLQKLVALKALSGARAQDPQFRDRFVRESRLAAGLDHDHIVPIYDAGEDGGLVYLAMRLVDGEDLDAVIQRDAPLEAGDVLEVFAQVASALDVAHAEGLIHRDVKPANILLERRRRDGGWHAYLADFGLTKYAGADSGPTTSGQVLGTPFYVAPEQIEGNVVDGRADQYSLGCVLFECLTGRRPFERDGALLAVIAAHAQAARPQVTAHRPDLPGDIDAVIARTLAVDPDQRYASCSDLVAAVEEALYPGSKPHPTAAATPSDTRPAPPEPIPAEPVQAAAETPAESHPRTTRGEPDPTAAPPASETPPAPTDAVASNAAEPAEAPTPTGQQPHQPAAAGHGQQQPATPPGVKPSPPQPPPTRQRPASREGPRRRWWPSTTPVLAAISAVRRLPRTVAGLIALVLLLGLLVGSYALLSRDYFVGVDNGEIAIFQGIPRSVLGLDLYWIAETTALSVDMLPDHTQRRLEAGVTTTSLADAREAIARYERAIDDDADEPQNDSRDGPEETEMAAQEFFSGAVPGRTDTFSIEGGLTVFEISSNGNGNFIAVLEDSEFDRITGLVNTMIGTSDEFDASTARHIEAGEYVLAMNGRDWSVTVRQPRYADGDTPPLSYSDEGFAATEPFKIEAPEDDGGAERTVNFAIVHEGEHNIRIRLLDKDGRRFAGVLNDLGPVDTVERAELPPGLYLLDVQAEGEWTIDVEIE